MQPARGGAAGGHPLLVGGLGLPERIWVYLDDRSEERVEGIDLVEVELHQLLGSELVVSESRVDVVNGGFSDLECRSDGKEEGEEEEAMVVNGSHGCLAKESSLRLFAFTYGK